MTSTRPDDGVAPAGQESLWERYGWLYSGIWLVFLIFPVTAALQADTSALQRAGAIGLLVAFAGVYLRGFLLQDRLPAEAVPAMSWRYLAVLAILALATTPTIGVEALGTAPFLVFLRHFRTAATSRHRGTHRRARSSFRSRRR